ncbi:MAG: hypothetical protein Q8S43_04520 [Actinomycetota bacterium]|nr:MAG: hypothetical protein FD171_1999 [Actinomycetota bacterium]MDO8950005.1 hypothetical protein [Actinomycetota bacterium]MDP3630202.1 hypothetical protein [Actinomycetota bacterium]
MNAFCAKAHFEEWAEARGHSAEDLFILPVAEAIVVAEWLFSA